MPSTSPSPPPTRIRSFVDRRPTVTQFRTFNRGANCTGGFETLFTTTVAVVVAAAAAAAACRGGALGNPAALLRCLCPFGP